jgi:hypothetical protein
LGIINSLINDAIGGNSPEPTSSDKVQKILSTKWDITDDFKITIINTFINTKFPEFKEELLFASENAVVSVDIPPMTSQELDEVLGGVRRNNVRIYESFRFGIRFRDYEGNRLRKAFTNIFIAQQYMYLDEIATTIEIKQDDKVLFKSEKCLITAIQQQTLDHQNTAIDEFEVTFITPTFSNTYIKDFGQSAEYSSSFV